MIEKLAEMPTYGAYKDSGVEWLGEVPAHWEVVPLKRSLSLNSEKISSRNSTLKYYGMENIESWTGRFKETESEIEGLANKFNENDILFGKLRPYLAKVGLATCEGICSTEFLVYRTKNQSANFFKYLLLSTDFINLVDASTYGSKMPRANADFIGIQHLPTPNLREQTAIAAFLDCKTAQIDQAMAIKEQQIALLKEHKQIQIQTAVTRGLDPNVPMRDSGVEWIGKIPVHWKIVKLKWLTTQIVDGAHFTPTYVDFGIPFLRVTDLSNMIDGKVNWDDVRYIPEKEHTELIKRANPKKGDVLLSKNGTIGLTKVIDWEREFSFFVSLCLIKLTRRINAHYFTAFFNSPIIDTQITFGSSRTSVTNLHLEKIKELLVILPPHEEQATIVTHIETQSAKIELAIAIQQQQIDKLKEYKATLINSAVTGKIRVAESVQCGAEL